MEQQAYVRDIMSVDVITLNEEQNLSHVAAQLDLYRFHHLPVVDGKKLVGMLSQRDVLKNTVSGVDRSAVAMAREARFLEQTFVRDVMKGDVVTVKADALVQSAAEQMLREGIGALPVVNDAGDLVGIVTERDILRLVAQRGLLRS